MKKILIPIILSCTLFQSVGAYFDQSLENISLMYSGEMDNLYVGGKSVIPETILGMREEAQQYDAQMLKYYNQIDVLFEKKGNDIEWFYKIHLKLDTIIKNILSKGELSKNNKRLLVLATYMDVQAQEYLLNHYYTENFIPYSSDDGYTIWYPNNWSVFELVDFGDGYIGTEFLPDSETGDSMNILTSEIPQELGDVSDEEILVVILPDIVQGLKDAGYQPSELFPVYMAGKPALSVTQDFDTGGGFQQIYFIHEQVIYVVTLGYTSVDGIQTVGDMVYTLEF